VIPPRIIRTASIASASNTFEVLPVATIGADSYGPMIPPMPVPTA